MCIRVEFYSGYVLYIYVYMYVYINVLSRILLALRHSNKKSPMLRIEEPYSIVQ